MNPPGLTFKRKGDKPPKTQISIVCLYFVTESLVTLEIQTFLTLLYIHIEYNSFHHKKALCTEYEMNK